jgi:hypothetical protein
MGVIPFSKGYPKDGFASADNFTRGCPKSKRAALSIFKEA